MHADLWVRWLAFLASLLGCKPKVRIQVADTLRAHIHR